MITMVDQMGYVGCVPEDEQVTRQRQMTTLGDRRDVADQQKASKYGRAVLSMPNRTGHARFRRGAVAPPASVSSGAAPARPPAALDFARCEGFSASASASANSSFPSSVTGGEGSVSNGRALLSAAGCGYSAGGNRPPPPPMQSASDYCHGLKRNYDDDGHTLPDNAGGAKHAARGAGRCHCSKKWKSRVKRSIRVPAISSKNADIPPDDCSWRKYGQKPIKGSPYPRGYYKCSTVRGCPARKHVERDPSEPAMLIVTYAGDHRHDTTAAAGTPEHRTT